MRRVSLASPNHVRFVDDGDNSEGGENVDTPPGTGAIETAFTAHRLPLAR